MDEASQAADRPSEPTEPVAADGRRQPRVDPRELAERVYKLMVAEVRLERARSGGAARCPER